MQDFLCTREDDWKLQIIFSKEEIQIENSGNDVNLISVFEGLISGKNDKLLPISELKENQ